MLGPVSNRVAKIVRRHMVPRVIVSLIYFLKYRSVVSTHAEVELSPKLRFGRGCVVGSFTKIKATDGPLTIGKESGIATNCFIAAGEGGIEIGDHFICGPSVNMIASNYVIERADVPVEQQGHSSKGIRIGRNVWLGAGVNVLDGTVLGDNTVVVAGSMVNRRYPPNCILQGSPAKVILKRQIHSNGES